MLAASRIAGSFGFNPAGSTGDSGPCENEGCGGNNYG